jgi:hypothetical protein
VVDDEERAFREAMRGARPLGGKPTIRGSNAISRERRGAAARSRQAMANAVDDLVVEQVGETITARRADVGHDVVSRARAAIGSC